MNVLDIDLEADFDYVTLTNSAYNVIVDVNRYNDVPCLTWDELSDKNKVIYVKLVKQITIFKIFEPEEFFELWKKTHIEDGWSKERMIERRRKWNPFLIEWSELKEKEKLQFQVFLYIVREMIELVLEV